LEEVAIASDHLWLHYGKDRNKIPEMPEFATLKTDSAFVELMASAPKPL
jgi:hypothetical protein